MAEAKPRPNQDEILRLGKRLTFRQAGEMYGVGHDTFRRWYYQAGAEKKDHNFIPEREELEEFCRVHGQDGALEHYGVTAITFRQWCRLRGVCYFDPKKFLSPAQVAKQLHLSRRGLQLWMRRNPIAGVVVLKRQGKPLYAIPVPAVEVIKNKIAQGEIKLRNKPIPRRKRPADKEILRLCKEMDLHSAAASLGVPYSTFYRWYENAGGSTRQRRQRPSPQEVLRLGDAAPDLRTAADQMGVPYATFYAWYRSAGGRTRYTNNRPQPKNGPQP
jgi:transposase-like protein